MKTEPNDSIKPKWTRYNGEDIPEGGLTKREMFAAMAMQGMLANTLVSQSIDMTAPSRFYTILSAASVMQADALIEALNKETK